MEKPFSVAPDIEVFSSWEEVPTLGFLNINSFVLKAREPVVIDTGMWKEKEEYMKALESVIDPKEIKWILLTHDDNDHKGATPELLEAAPNARLVTQFIGVGRMMDTWPVPLERCYLMNPGDSIDLGDRTLTAIRPPQWDSPPSLAYYDSKSGALFSSDCFGAMIPAKVQDVADVPEADLQQGFMNFASIVSPWIHLVDEGKYAKMLDVVRHMAPTMILSCHSPPARGKTDQYLKWLAAAPSSEMWVGPNQAAMEAMMAQMQQGPPPES